MKRHIAIRSGSLRMGGLERILIELLKELDKDKYKITLFIEDDCKEENIFEKDIPSEVEYHFLKDYSLISLTERVKARKKNIFYKIFYNILMSYEKIVAFKNLKKHITKDMEVLVDFDAGLTKDAHKLKDIKKVAWIHNSIPKLKKKKAKIKRFGNRLDNYQGVVGICDDMKEELENIYPFLKGRVHRIYNLFNFDRILSLSEDDSNLTEDEKDLLKDEYILSVSRLDNVQKDYHTLLLAYKEAVEKGFNKKLFIIGHGPSREEIEKWIVDLSLEGSVKLLGLKKNPYIFMKNAHYFVHSSKYEGLPTVLIEAMICGKSVVSSDCPTGPREILDNGRCGILVEVGNHKEFGEAIVKMDKNLKEFEEKVFTRVEDFEKKKILKDIDKLISSL